MHTNVVDERKRIRAYYDQNTLRFLSYGAQRKLGTIHRPVWGEGVESNAQALHYVDQQILNEAFNIKHLAQDELHVADFGCGVGASLFYLADNPSLAFMGVGLTISPVQARFAQNETHQRKLNHKYSFVLGDFLTPALTNEFDLVFSIESFAHTSQPEAYFRAVSHVLKPGGRLVICDDYLSSNEDHFTLSSIMKDILEVYQWGWGVPGVWSTRHVANLAEQVNLQLISNRNLTPYLKLHPIPGIMIKLLMAAYRISGMRDLYLRSVIGGQALQSCLNQGLVEYRYLVFERSE